MSLIRQIVMKTAIIITIATTPLTFACIVPTSLSDWKRGGGEGGGRRVWGEERWLNDGKICTLKEGFDGPFIAVQRTGQFDFLFFFFLVHCIHENIYFCTLCTKHSLFNSL